MPKYDNCRADNNVGGGFLSTSPFAEFRGCTAEGNGGPGFVDASGQPVEALVKILTSLKGNASVMKAGSRQQETLQTLNELEVQVKSSVVDKGLLVKTFHKLGELTKDFASESAAQSIFLFVQKMPQVLTMLHDAGVLNG